MDFVIACLRSYTKHKIRHFTGSRAVDGKEMYKKNVMHMQSCCFAFFTFSSSRRLLTCCYLPYIVMSQKQDIIGANSITPADSISIVFSTHR